MSADLIVVGSTWARADETLPPGKPAQVRAWLSAAAVPMTVVVLACAEGSIDFTWQGAYAPVDLETGHLVPLMLPGHRGAWAPVNTRPIFRLPHDEFVAAFQPVPS